MRSLATFVIKLKSGKTVTFPKGSVKEFQFMKEGALYIRSVDTKKESKKEIEFKWKRHWFPLSNIEDVEASSEAAFEGEDEVEYYKEWLDYGIDLMETTPEEQELKLNFPPDTPSPELNTENMGKALDDFTLRAKNKKKIES